MTVGEGGSGGVFLMKGGLVNILRMMMGGAWTRMGWGG